MLKGVKERSKFIIEKLTGLKLDADFQPTGLAEGMDKDAKTSDGKSIEDVLKEYVYGIWPSFKKGIVSVSGMGLMLGIQTEKEAKAVVNKAIEKGTIALTAKTKVRLLPALNIPMELLDKGLDTIVEAINEV